MCDPIGAIGLAFSIGSAAMQYSAQQDLVNKQNEANDAWLAYQRQKMSQENERQARERNLAEASREDALNQVTAPAQEAAQQKEAGRLTDYMTQQVVDPANKSLNDDLQQGNLKFASPDVKNAYAAAITQATRSAQQRLQALAQVQSYGDSQFGLANRANVIFNKAAQNIAMIGDIRQGSLAAYGAEKQVEPIKYQMGPSMASAIGGLGSGVAKMAGGSIGASLAGSV